MKEMIAMYEEERQTKIITNEPFCPVCEIILTEDDCFDHEYDGYCLERLCVGHCPECGENYQWREVFFYSGHSQLKKSED